MRRHLKSVLHHATIGKHFGLIRRIMKAKFKQFVHLQRGTLFLKDYRWNRCFNYSETQEGTSKRRSEKDGGITSAESGNLLLLESEHEHILIFQYFVVVLLNLFLFGRRTCPPVRIKFSHISIFCKTTFFLYCHPFAKY